MQKGIITFTKGVMGSGKSLWLINEVVKKQYADYATLTFVPKIIHKPGFVYSRFGQNQCKEGGSDLEDRLQGVSIPALTIKDSKQFRQYIDGHLQKIREAEKTLGFRRGQYRLLISIDEVQFLDSGIVKQVQYCQNEGIDVNLTGLVLNYRGDPFIFVVDKKDAIGNMLCIADVINEEKSTCQWKKDDGSICGKPADRTQRFRGLDHKEPSHYEDKLVVVDGRYYIPSCKNCHKVPWKF